MTRLFAVIVLVSTLGLVSGPPAEAEAPAQRAGHVYKDFVPTASDPAELREAWRKWQRHEPDDYVVRVKNHCFCLDRPPLDTYVVDGEVKWVRYAPIDVGRDLRRKGYDMDRMFVILRDAYAHADRLAVDYNNQGVPRRISIDWNFMIADEEAYYTVRATYPRLPI